MTKEKIIFAVIGWLVTLVAGVFSGTQIVNVNIDDTIKKYEEQIEELENVLAEKDVEIEDKLTEKDEEIEELKGEIAKKDVKIRELEGSSGGEAGVISDGKKVRFSTENYIIDFVSDLWDSDSIKMDGKQYTNVVKIGGGSYDDGEAVFRFDRKFKTLSFTLGVEDSGSFMDTHPRIINFYADGELVKEIVFTIDTDNLDIEIPLNNCEKMKLEWKNIHPEVVGLGNAFLS